MRAALTQEAEVFPQALMRAIEERLARFVAEAGYSTNLRDAVGYSLLGGGKRLRPLLALRCCEAVGGSPATALEGACAVEMVHAFSLVHDDLPALDNDLTRRGKPTVHVAYGEAMAVLAGDALLALAMHAACESRDDPARIVREVTNATTAMITGQVLDTLGGFPEGHAAEQRLTEIHSHKTGALIRCACRVGALAAGARPAAFAACDRWGDLIGLMFQVVDDLLDVTQSEAHIGKAVAKDASAGKLTYPEVFGVERTRHEVARLRAEALSALEPLGQSAEHLLTLTEFLAGRTR
jgi:geranylgeranyl diphosphate synthase type II